MEQLPKLIWYLLTIVVNGYTFVSFDVKFLFSNVNINYIYVNRVYSEKEISTVLNKRSLKVARVVKLKSAFMGWFFYNLVILIKLYEIRYLNLDKILFFLRNQTICLKNLKFRAPTTTKSNINTSVNTSVWKPGLFLFLEITEDLNNIKKIRTHFCRHW